MRYRKIDPRVWNDEKFSKLTPIEKLIALYVVTAQVNRIGFFSFSPGRAVEETNIPPATFRKSFEKVVETLGWSWDSDARVVYIPTWFKYNLPENRNVLKGCLGDLHEVPQTRLFTAFSENLSYLPETLHQTFRERLGKRYPKPSPIQEQEQEQDQEQEQESESPSGSVATAPPRDGDGKRFSPDSDRQRARSEVPKAMRLPIEFTLDEDLEAFARDHGLNPSETLAAFRDYWHAEAGQNARKADWRAAFKTWCRREQNYRTRWRGGRKESALDMIKRRLAEEVEDQENENVRTIIAEFTPRLNGKVIA